MQFALYTRPNRSQMQTGPDPMDRMHEYLTQTAQTEWLIKLEQVVFDIILQLSKPVVMRPKAMKHWEETKSQI